MGESCGRRLFGYGKMKFTMNKSSRIYLVLALLCLGPAAFTFADSPSSSSDGKTATDASVAPVQVPPVDTSADTKTSYLYDLKKLIDISRENIKEVNEKIKEQAILKRNQKREERAREYYEKGVELTNEGKLNEARDYFEKAIRITEHPEMTGYIRESQRRLRRQEAALQAQERQHYDQMKQGENTRKEDVEEAYREAVELYKQKKYHPAKDAFEHVDEIVPDYRATDSYLKIIDQDIILADAEAAKQQAGEIARQQQEAEAARAKEKQMWLQQIEEKEKERKESIDHQAEGVYDQAVELYKQKKFAEAKKKFEEVSWVIPDYKSTMRYLARIDRDAQLEEERVAQEQQKALEEQHWEEIVAEKKQEAARAKEMEIKKRQQEQQLEDQAAFLYTIAINLYDKNQMDEALSKFNDIEKLVPNYKSTRAYLAKIQQIEYERNPQVVVSPAPSIASTTVVVPLNSAAIELKHANEYQDTEKRAHEMYVDAIFLYRHYQLQDARAKFEAVDELIPDYKHTDEYLAKIAQSLPNIPAPAPAPINPSPVNNSIQGPAVSAVVVTTPQPAPEPIIPPQVKATISLEDQQKQAQEIAEMAQQSAELYRQIASITDDSTMAQTKKKMAQLDDVISNMKENKDHVLRQLREEEWRNQQQESRQRQGQMRAQAADVYNQAMDLWRAHDYSKAKLKFLEVENMVPNYRGTRRNLERLDADIKKANLEVVTAYEKNQSERLKELQDKENRAVMANIQQEQLSQQQLAQQQEASARDLAQKVAQINDDIIQLSKTQDYQGMKAKFEELQNTVTALTTLKDEMAKEKDHLAREKELADETMHEHQLALKAQEEEDQQIHAYYGAETYKEYRPVLSEQTSDVDTYKRREIMQEQNDLFSEAVDRYEHKKYTQAKLLFGELADQNDRRAEAWLKRVDHAITQEVLVGQESEERERTAFLQDQLQAQRQLVVIQERERQRQKALTEELERQKRLYEDDQLLELRKEQVMRAQERERQRQEAKRLAQERENAKREQMLHFHRVQVPVVANPQPPAVKPAPAVVAPQPVTPSGLTPEQLKAQEEFSQKRKEYLDQKYQEALRAKQREAQIEAAKEDHQRQIEQREQEKAQRERERLAKIEAAKEERQRQIEERDKERAEQQKQEEERRQQQLEAREKLKEERQKAIEQQEQLRLQREQEREARIKAIEEARIAAAHAAEQRAAEEKQHREELQREAEQQREEQIKQQEIEREESEHRQEIEHQEQERQAQLEAQREAVRQQLEDGVEEMYQNALSLYNQGQYTAAADRFKDIQDIIPGYKRSEQYMDDARQKAIAANSEPVSQPAAAAPAVASDDSSTPVSHDQSVSKALDLFDPNAK